MFAAGPPDAPLAKDNDNPAAPSTGTAFLRRFRFGVCFCIAEISHWLRRTGQMLDAIAETIGEQVTKRLAVFDRCDGTFTKL
jgi:hypothetical protein